MSIDITCGDRPLTRDDVVGRLRLQGNNARVIAGSKVGQDRLNWIDDAEFYEAAVRFLSACTSQPTQTQGGAQEEMNAEVIAAHARGMARAAQKVEALLADQRRALPDDRADSLLALSMLAESIRREAPLSPAETREPEAVWTLGKARDGTIDLQMDDPARSYLATVKPRSGIYDDLESLLGSRDRVQLSVCIIPVEAETEG